MNLERWGTLFLTGTHMIDLKLGNVRFLHLLKGKKAMSALKGLGDEKSGTSTHLLLCDERCDTVRLGLGVIRGELQGFRVWYL